MGTQHPLEKSLRIEIANLPPISRYAYIYRVPKELRSVNEKAYTPQIVSIGPMHYGKTELQAMEEHKLRCLQAFLDRTKTSLEDCIGVVKELEERARNCYNERIHLTSDQFVKLLLMDSCLIIEIMSRSSFNTGEEPTDTLSKHILSFGISMDMVLLENQIPFFVLESIFRLGIFNYPNTNNFLELSLVYFAAMVVFHDQQAKIGDVMQYVERGNAVKHFVDLLRIYHLPSTSRSSSYNIPKVMVYNENANYLQEAGMNIKKGSSKCVLDITYTNGVLEIPRICVADES